MVARILYLMALGSLLSASAAMAQIDPNLIGWWNFEEGQGTVALDSSGHGHHGTLMGDPQWVPGYDGLALDLDGQGDYIETGKLPSELGVGGDAPRTIALWVYTRSFNGGGLYEMGGDGELEGFSVRTGERYRWWRAEHGGDHVDFYAVWWDEWIHVTHVHDGSKTHVYVDGHGAITWPLTLQTSDGAPFRIGICGDAAFDGLIDDVRLYDRAVTWREIERIMYGSPLEVSAPQPPDNSITDVVRSSVLSWTRGATAYEHDVYLGTDEAEVRDASVATEGIYRGRQAGDVTRYMVPEEPLEENAIYYWRVDEIRVDGTITQGRVWSFQTADYLIIDDFESYTDELGSRIYETWIDGWDNGTGAVVGYMSSGSWQLARGGHNSMPFNYDNRVDPWYSEAVRTWAEPQDWTRHGVDTLRLYYHGGPLRDAQEPGAADAEAEGLIQPRFASAPHVNDPEQLYIGLVDDAGNLLIVRHPDRLAVGALAWLRWDIPLDDFRAAGVDVTAITQMIVGAGDRDNPTPAGEGLAYFDDIRLVRSGETAIIDSNLVGWWNFEEDGGTVAVDSSGHGHHGTLMGDPQWVPGYDGLALDLDGQGDYIETNKLPSELGIGGDAPRTVTLWAYTRSFNGGGLYEMGGDGNREGFSLRTREIDDGWQVRYGGIDANFAAPSLNEWIHLTHTYEVDFALVYINGWEAAYNWGDIHATDAGTLKIGICGEDTFDGLVDDVRLYDRAVRQDEIARVMQGSPLLAWPLRPPDGGTATVESLDSLAWSAGAMAAGHDVYFGTDVAGVREATVATEGVYRGRQSAEVTSYMVPEQPLEWDGTYYWRVDEVDADGAIAKGKVWSFHTADYLIIDDFESYDDDKNRIYETWIDGWDNGTGSIVGYLESPFAEITIVHSGWQSMPFSYDNTRPLWYSEAVRTWNEPQDWTRFGVDALTLYLIGYPIAFLERQDGTIIMGGGGVYSADDEDGFSFAHRSLDGDGSIVVRVASLAETGPAAQAGVMIRGSLSGKAQSVAVTVTAGNGVAFWHRRDEEGSTERGTRSGLQVPYWVRLTREGDMVTASCSADGVEWVGVADDPAASSVEMAMDEKVYIGVVVTGGLHGGATGAEFSDISLTGNVTGSWEVGEIGSKYAYQGNDPDPVYVAVADEAGNLAVVTHPDPLVVGAALWQEWAIPLSEFVTAGVDVTRVTQMTVGVGDRDNPIPSGGGMLHFDDFRLTRPNTATEPNAVP